jgi:hypothetical protein
MWLTQCPLDDYRILRSSEREGARSLAKPENANVTISREIHGKFRERGKINTFLF